MIKIIICDDQTVVREGLAAIIGSDPEISVIESAENGIQAIKKIKQNKPDLVLMDLNMPEMNGIQATKELKKLYPQLPILVLTTYAKDEWIFDAIRAGASGYLLKDTRREELLSAIKGTVNGQTFIDPSIAGKLFNSFVGKSIPLDKKNIPDFNDRETDILPLLVKGLSNPQIADRLFLAPGTVRNYVSSIFQKLNVSDRTQAALKAVKLGIVEP